MHVVPEALGLLDFCQELIHLPAAADLGVVGTISHPVVTWLPAWWRWEGAGSHVNP